MPALGTTPEMFFCHGRNPGDRRQEMIVLYQHLHALQKHKLQPLGKLHGIQAEWLGALERLLRWRLGLPHPQLPELDFYLQQAVGDLIQVRAVFTHASDQSCSGSSSTDSPCSTRYRSSN